MTTSFLRKLIACLLPHMVYSTIVRGPCSTSADFSIVMRDKRMKGYVIQLVSDVDDAQCMVECVRNPKCKSYNIHPEERKCKLNSKALVDGISLTDDPGWFYKSTDYNQTSDAPRCRDVDADPCGPSSLGKDSWDFPNEKCQQCDPLLFGSDCKSKVNTKAFQSCSELHRVDPSLKSAVYALSSGKHHCVMEGLEGCEGGGWTLVMKTDGNEATFKSDSKYWTNEEVYNVEQGLQSFDTNEAKFAGFSKISFDHVCVGVRFGGQTRWMSILMTSSSLLDIFKSGEPTATSLPKEAWINLIPGVWLQNNCLRQGFNVLDERRSLRLRVGIVGNNENDCFSVDTYVGIGGSFSPSCCGRHKTSMGFILVR